MAKNSGSFSILPEFRHLGAEEAGVLQQEAASKQLTLQSGTAEEVSAELPAAQPSLLMHGGVRVVCSVSPENSTPCFCHTGKQELEWQCLSTLKT